MRKAVIRLFICLILACCMPIASADTQSILNAVDKSIRLRNYEQAIALLKPLLKQNNAIAQFRMAGLFRSGKGVSADANKALALYEKSARQGHAEAQFSLASMLQRQGADNKQLRHWLQQSADQGHALAIRKLNQLKTDQGTQDMASAAIFYAIRHNKISTIKSLIDSRKNLNIVDSAQRSPLLTALMTGHKEMAALLLPGSKQLDLKDKNGTGPIHSATRQGFEEIVKQLIKRDIDINTQDALGNTALMIAVIHNNSSLTEILLTHRADTRIKNRKKQTAIDLAHTHNALASFDKFNIDTGRTNTDSQTIDIKAFEHTIRSSASLYRDWPLLSIASHLGEKAVVAQLIKQAVDINATDPDGNGALHRAAASGQLTIVKRLAVHGARINAINKRKQTPLMLAAQSGHSDILKYLLDNSAKTDLISSSNNSALSLAIRNHHADSALLLINRSLDKRARYRALHLAISSNLEPIAISLCRDISLLTMQDNKRRTPLWLATEAGFSHLVSTLLGNQTALQTIDQPDIQGYTPLARATLANRRNIVKKLIEKGANKQSLTKEKNSLLMLASLSGHSKLASYFIASGAPLDQINQSGDTALMLAASQGENIIIEILIEAGADLQRRNHDDLNAYQIAVDSGHEKTATLLKSRSGALFQLFN